MNNKKIRRIKITSNKKISNINLIIKDKSNNILFNIDKIILKSINITNNKYPIYKKDLFLNLPKEVYIELDYDTKYDIFINIFDTNKKDEIIKIKKKNKYEFIFSDMDYKSLIFIYKPNIKLYLSKLNDEFKVYNSKNISNNSLIKSDIYYCSDIELIDNIIIIDPLIEIQIVGNISFNGNMKNIEISNDLEDNNFNGIFSIYNEKLEELSEIKNIVIKNNKQNLLKKYGAILIKNYSLNFFLKNIDIDNIFLNKNLTSGLIGYNCSDNGIIKIENIKAGNIEIGTIDNIYNFEFNISGLIGSHNCINGNLDIKALVIEKISNYLNKTSAIVGNLSLDNGNLNFENCAINYIINEGNNFCGFVGDNCLNFGNININNCSINNINSGTRNNLLNKNTVNFAGFVGNNTCNYGNININKSSLNKGTIYGSKWGGFIGNNCGLNTKSKKLKSKINITNCFINIIQVYGDYWGILIGMNNSCDTNITNFKVKTLLSAKGNYFGGLIAPKCFIGKDINNNLKINDIYIKELSLEGDKFGGIIGISSINNFNLDLMKVKIDTISLNGNFFGGICAPNCIDNKSNKNICNIKDIKIDYFYMIGQEWGGVLGTNNGFNGKINISDLLINTFISKGIDWGGICATYCQNINISNCRFNYVEILDLYESKWGIICSRFCKNIKINFIVANNDEISNDGKGMVGELGYNIKQTNIFWNKGFKLKYIYYNFAFPNFLNRFINFPDSWGDKIKINKK